MSDRSKYFCFTINNPTDEDHSAILQYETHGCSYVLFGHETGETGTYHYQGYCEFNTVKRIATVSRWLRRAHFEVRKGTQQQAINYIKNDPVKHATTAAVFEEFGTPFASRQGARNDIYAALQSFDDQGLAGVISDHRELYVRYAGGFEKLASKQAVPRSMESEPERVLLIGPPGCGKTSYYYQHEDGDPSIIDASVGYWFNGLQDGTNHALLDDFDGKASKWTLTQTLNITDRYPRKVPTKGGFTPYLVTRLYVSTNLHPQDWYDYSNRRDRYAALCRRFTRVILWDQDNPDDDPTWLPDPTRFITLTPEHPWWSRFWKGPAGRQRILDVESGRLQSRAPDFYYNFIDY